MRFRKLTTLLFTITLLAGLLQLSSVPIGDETALVRQFTRDLEFDYIAWTLEAIGVKGEQAALGNNAYLSQENANQLFLDYLDLVREVQRLDREVQMTYTNPEIIDPEDASADLRLDLAEAKAEVERLAPYAETTLEAQVTTILGELGLSVGGQPVPPVLYHNSTVPMALIVSPRGVIEQQNNISVQPDMPLEKQITLEDDIAEALDVSTLVVPIGGVGVYPTMVYQTSNINWLAEVVAHEWTHNFLSLRPLGLNYGTSPELRTINETAANLTGKEVGQAVIQTFYSEFAPPPPEPTEEAPTPDEGTSVSAPTPEPEIPAFDFNTEMRITRERTDDLLAAGEIEEAETYMESRRQVFWEQGYRIRKLNQAYFAFYGAYADTPGGAAGTDPVGEAVRTLRAQHDSLADFLNQISWVTSFEGLRQLVKKNQP